MVITRIIFLDFLGQELNDVGPRVTIAVNGSILDDLEIKGEMSWARGIDLDDGDHTLEITLHNEDNDRFFDWGEDPNGTIRYLRLVRMRFANDGINPIQFDLSEDDLEDGTKLFQSDAANGIVQADEGLEIYKNSTARIILPARDPHLR